MHGAFSQFPRVFDDVQRELIKLGEEGHLHTIFKRLSDIAETRRLYRRRVQQTLIAPGIALVVCFLINLLAPRLVFPALEGMLKNLGLTVPFFSKLVFGCAQFFTSLWFWGPVVLVGIWMYQSNHSERYDVSLKKWKARLFRAPFISRLIRHHTYSEWSKLLALQLEAGCLPDRAVGNLRKASIDPNFEQVTRKLKHAIANPSKDVDHIIAEAMLSTGYFEPTMVEFVRVGEESGQLPLMLNSASRLYNESFQAALDRFEALLSPALTAFTGFIIGAWVIAFILPLAQIIGTL
jgi:type II secretory pathway component PulF